MNSPFPHWRFTRAGLLLLLVLCIIQVASGNDSWDESRRNGTIAREQGRYPEAKRFLEAAVARLSDPKDPRRADLDDELASVYELLGEWGAAEHAYRDALTIIENDRDNQLGIRTAIGGDFGAFLATQGRFKEAGELLEAALATSRKAFGESDIGTATLKSSLGRLYFLEGKLTDAEPLLHQAVEVHREALPPSHLDRIMSESVLGYLYLLEGRFEKAEPILRQVSDAARQLGDSHPTLAFTLTNLADLYRAEGKSARSEPLFRNALAIYAASLGPESLKVAETLLDMSIDTIASGKFAVAERDLSKGLDILRKINGPEDTTVALGEYWLARAYTGEGRYAEAEVLLRHALPIEERRWPEGSVTVGDCLYATAEAERLQRHYANAELLYQRTIALYEKCDSSGTPKLTVALRQYAKLLKTGRTDEAKALEKRAQSLR